MTELLFLLVGLAIGSVAVWLVASAIHKKKTVITPEEWDALKQERDEIKNELRFREELLVQLKEETAMVKQELSGERNLVVELNRQLSAKDSDYRNLRERLAEQKKEIEELQLKFASEFKNLANEIFEEKSKKFTDQNKSNLSDLLNPLKEKITEFEKKVEQTNKESIERNSALKEQILSLKELNQQITKEAENLTKALKGEAKTQGNWGEVILEKILEKSGLIKGEHYETQVSITNVEGKRLQPDVVVRLPENKNIVIDSKVSLVAYERYVNSDDEVERMRFIKEHLASIRLHIRSLSEKNYQSLYDIGSLDFVLLFMPLEPAFSLAVQNDTELFTDAYERNIVIVSPTTLIATLRTISSIWRQEQQGRNALEIARQGGLLYDKFVAFTEDLKKVGQHIESSKAVYTDAMKKLYEGKDNLTRKAERLKELGAKTTKSVDQRLLDRATE